MKNTKRMIGYWTVVLACFSSVLWAGCSDADEPGYYYGPTVSIADGTVRPFIHLGGDSPEIGLSLAQGRKTVSKAPQPSSVNDAPAPPPCGGLLSVCQLVGDEFEFYSSGSESEESKKDG